ncbi:mitochondrial ribosomal protein subunit L20-domain-containing protein [Rhypophila decipiens]|uniref:Mitochondrial ribosomal protein subunit L20-domain-containing protein n=1 Tax=Rhypophila decipiens TaxID=261697 RepID=A0AAN6YKS7_9PEZI|nr:mitochondrial ribosomal protein subunit L20-domain-containing protein [Rhypophila decipiens]
MEAQLTRRSATACSGLLSCSSRSSSGRLFAPSTKTVAVTSIRQKSSAARLRRALNIPPHPSFVLKDTSADRIIFNPPSSEASVFHTPFKFLPKSDPRRRQNIAELFKSQATGTEGTVATGSPSLDPARLPVVKKWAWEQKPHHVTAEQVAEIRRLRTEDPVTNSVHKLADKYNCSALFIRMCVQAPKEHKEKVKAEEDRIKARWGPIRSAARAERKRRIDMLFAGEL